MRMCESDVADNRREKAMQNRGGYFRAQKI